MRTVSKSQRGSNIIKLPEDYTVLDIETTGLSFQFDKIIEIAAIKVQEDIEVSRFESLVRLPSGETLPEDIIELTGINDEMLNSAPPINEVLPKFLSFLNEDLIIGHNVNFDVHFLYDVAQELGFDFKNDYIDTLRLSRKLFPEERHHRLSDMVNLLRLPVHSAHRSKADVEATYECYKSLKVLALSKMSEQDFIASFESKSADYSKVLNTIKPTVDTFDDTNPFYGKVVVFTGALSRMSRRNAWQEVANLGGLPENRITKKTNYLVIGDEDFVASVKDGKSSKMKKADEYQRQGLDIVTLPESTFFEILKEYKPQ